MPTSNWKGLDLPSDMGRSGCREEDMGHTSPQAGDAYGQQQ
jgi:hypothetical protein